MLWCVVLCFAVPAGLGWGVARVTSPNGHTITPPRPLLPPPRRQQLIDEASERVAKDDVRATLEVQKQTPTPVGTRTYTYINDVL